jgi:peptidoglycan/LPS O-acetylase OafA/YrhL
MLPLLFFELLWKVMWVVAWGLPLWSTQQLTLDSEQTLISNLVGVVLVPLAIPWGYVFKQYVKAPGDRWGRRPTLSAPSEPPLTASATAAGVP